MKNLEKLAGDAALFDETLIDAGKRSYKRTVNSFNKATKMGYSVVTYIDGEYPDVLRKLDFPPPVLYVRGNVAVLKDVLYVGIVGSRKCDMYGIQTANKLAQEIGQTGVGIVSGGAEGVDAAAHTGALRAKAPTIAVMGSGLDVIYPACNRELFQNIEDAGGAIISEFPFGTPPKRKNFPQRNRLIAAFSEVLVLARAADRSGGLITVRQALDMNKTVFAVPGNIDSPLSIGANALIRDGAIPLTSAMDVIDELIGSNPDYFVKEHKVKEYVKTVPEEVEKETSGTGIKLNMNLSEYEQEIVNIINEGFTTQSEMENKVSFEASRLAALLGMMEIKGIIKTQKTYKKVQKKK